MEKIILSINNENFLLIEEVDKNCFNCDKCDLRSHCRTGDFGKFCAISRNRAYFVKLNLVSN